VLFITIKASAVLLVAATATFNQLQQSQAVEKTINRYKSESSKYKTPRYRNSKQIKSLQIGKFNHSSHKFKVSGYLGQTFVYGEVILLKNGTLEGYIYFPKNSKTYVYGEQSQDKINLYDSNGNLYQMLRQK